MDLHRAFKNEPGLINRCNMFELSSEDCGERIKISMFLPGIEWILANRMPSKFPSFPISFNGSKYAVPLYLDLIMQRVKEKQKMQAGPESVFNHFPVLVGHKKVQILIYGPDCVFPFRVTAK